jgi:hypothetical protein
MSIAFRARASSALVGACAAVAVVAQARVSLARASRDVFGPIRDDDRDGEADTRGETVLGRAFRRDATRAWNQGIDRAFGAWVKALSARGL